MLKQVTKDSFYKQIGNINCYLSVVTVYGKYHTVFINKKDKYVVGVLTNNMYFVLPDKYKLSVFFVYNKLLHVTFLNDVCYIDH